MEITSTRTYKQFGQFTARYRGGAYIEISRPGGNAFDVINVYDYAEGRPEIGRTPGVSVRDEVVREFRRWMRESAGTYTSNGY